VWRVIEKKEFCIGVYFLGSNSIARLIYFAGAFNE
jgi:hypothetical protein